MDENLKKLYDSWDTKQIARENLRLAKELIDNTDGNDFKKINEIHEKMDYLFKINKEKHNAKSKKFIQDTGIILDDDYEMGE